jgi:hypothetical protein
MIVTHEPETWRGAVDLRLLLSPGGVWQVQPSADPPPHAGAEPGAGHGGMATIG